MSQAGLAARAAGRASRNALTGTRIRERRTVMGIRQTDLARTVEISPSYLNLIEHNRRRIGGKLLVDLAAALGVEVSALTHGAETELLDQLSEAAHAAREVAAELPRAEEFVGRFPGWAQLIAAQHSKIAQLQRQVNAMADRLTHDPALSNALHEMLSKVTAIQSTAVLLAETKDLDRVWQDRFIANLSQDSQDLAARSAALVGYLDASANAELTPATPQEELEAFLARSGFHLAALERGGAVAPFVERTEDAFQSDAARASARDYFARYKSDADALPLEDLKAAICDGSGALTLRKPTEGFAIPRFGSGCPLWPLYRALGQPGRPISDRIGQADAPDRVCRSYAVCAPVLPMGFDGRQPMESTMLVVPHSLMAADARPRDADPEVRAGWLTCGRDPCSARRDLPLLGEIF